MATIKKCLGSCWRFALLAVAAVWIAGCAPSGPRALLDGKRLLDEGQYADAIEKLKLATTLLRTNAVAWNYLGLACHHAGQPANAVAAYQMALKLNRDLAVAHYNLGCLMLEQNRLDEARNELTAFVLHNGNAPEGWLKLGSVQLRQGDLSDAERSFGEASRLSPQNPEPLNDLGIVARQRNRYRDAISYFNAALRQQPNYAPALLNVAVVLQMYPNSRPLALQKYREYLALTPHPANWDEVNAIAHGLDLELNPPVAQRAPNNNPTPENPEGNGYSTRQPASNPTRNESNPNHQKATEESASESTSRPEVVTVAPPPVVRSPEETVVTTTPPSTVVVRNSQTEPLEIGAPPPKRGFFTRINPINLFRHRPIDTPAPLPPVVLAQPDPAKTTPMYTNPPPVSKTPPKPVVSSALTLARYNYLSPAKPAPGDRDAAERHFAEGLEAQKERHFHDAVKAYRAAVQADPSFFEAQSNLGLAAYNTGDLPLSLFAYETALAIAPDSFSARFDFALALKKANYLIDAAKELEKVLVINAGETPTHLAAAHLTLANLYSDEFHQPAAARPHYTKVLELDPHNGQATAIRYWLQDNP